MSREAIWRVVDTLAIVAGLGACGFLAFQAFSVRGASSYSDLVLAALLVWGFVKSFRPVLVFIPLVCVWLLFIGAWSVATSPQADSRWAYAAYNSTLAFCAFASITRLVRSIRSQLRLRTPA